MAVAESINVDKFVGMLKIFAPEFNAIPDSAFKDIKDPKTYIPVSYCNIIEFSVSSDGYVPEDTYGHKVIQKDGRSIISIDITSYLDNLIRYAQSNKIDNHEVISRILKNATEDEVTLKIHGDCYLEYDNGIWMFVTNNPDSVGMSWVCRFDTGDGMTAMIFSENSRSSKIQNPKPKTQTYKEDDVDDIAWDILFNISESFTKYLYRMPVEHFAINDQGEFLEVYVKTSSFCQPPDNIPNGWRLLKAEDTIFKFRYVQPKSECACEQDVLEACFV